MAGRRTGVPRLSINVSVREMRSAGYVERVAAILAETGFPPEKLEIEVTESIIQRVDQSLQLFRRLKALGYRSPSTTSAPASHP